LVVGHAVAFLPFGNRDCAERQEAGCDALARVIATGLLNVRGEPIRSSPID
jgi:hypothetical protein